MKQSSSRETTVTFAALIKLWPWLKPHKTAILIGSVMIPVVALISMIQPLIIKRAIDDGITKGDMERTLYWASIGLGMSFLTYLFSGIQAIATSSAVHKMIRDLRSALMTHVLNLSPSWHDGQISGALATRATSDFDTLSESLNQGVLSSVIDLLVLAGCIAGMFILSAKLALTAIIILPIMTWLVIWFSRKLNSAMLASRKSLAALNGFTQEALTSLSAVKLLNAEPGVSQRYGRLNREYRDAQLENVFYDALMFATIDGISSITLGIALFLTIRWSGYSEQVTAGLMVAFVQYVGQIFEPLKQLGTKMAMLQGAFTSMDRIFGLLDSNDTVGGNQSVTWTNKVDVEFKNVSYSYKKSSPNVLSNINLKIPSGRSLAIIGRTGSGKSTIIRLLSKLYDGYEGEILVSGTSIKELKPTEVRAHMGIVPQDIVMFEGSIAFNIALGHQSASREDVQRAAEIVGADSFIAKLPGRYDFTVKENGANLSHGQRQLIVFARALVGNPSLLILDEATSSIDPQSESLIQKATAKLLTGRTVIVIAHRLETIKRCDSVMVVENGKVVEMGSPIELNKSGTRYHELVSLGSSKSNQIIE